MFCYSLLSHWHKQACMSKVIRPIMPKYESRLLYDILHVLLCNYAMCIIYVCACMLVCMYVYVNMCVYTCVHAFVCREADGHHLLVVYRSRSKCVYGCIKLPLITNDATFKINFP